MLSFQNYEKDRFSKTDWRFYLESMIAMDPQDVSVYLSPPEGFLGTKTANGAAKNPHIKLQYMHHIEPRKIAHRILTIREDVSGELIADLKCIRSEHNEAQRYASEKMLEGKEKAEFNRRLTRNSEDEECTPLRNQNYHEISVYITNVALDIVKHQLGKGKSSTGIDFLDSVLAKLDKEHEDRDVLERFLHSPRGPCYLIEELYFEGIMQGVSVQPDGDSLNKLKIAQDVMTYRY